MVVADSLLLYKWLLTSAALQSQFLGSNVFVNQTRDHYDFVIVGGGTAGCVLASRLSEIPDFNVLLLERGNSGNDFIDVNMMTPDADSEEFAEKIPSVKQENAWQSTAGIAEYQIGRGLGGGSTLNAMNFVVGTPLNYDTWAKMGATGWSYKDVLPYFKKLESIHPSNGYKPNATSHEFEDAQPLPSFPTAVDAFLEEAKDIGYEEGDYSRLFNSFDAPQLSVFNGGRSSTRRAYLLPALERPNLDVVCQATVTRILFEGDRAVGVEYERSGLKKKALADKEVIVSASALRSPQLLMVSGIGPAASLNKFGIPVVKDSPGVGMNLQDHQRFRVVAKLEKPLYRHDLVMRDIRDFDDRKTGPLTTTGLLGLGSLTNYQSVNEQDTRYQIPMMGVNTLSVPNRKDKPSAVGQRFRSNSLINDDGVITLNTIVFESLLLIPDSRGTVTISSGNMHDIPVVDGQILSAPEDRGAAVDLLKTVFTFGKTKAIQQLGVKKLTVDTDDLCTQFEAESDAFFECAAKQYTQTAWHYCGTARMGSLDDPLAVVDPSLKVIGVKGLRVIDASVMPTVPRGNINVPVIMVAEKGADMIKQEYGRSTGNVMLKSFDDVQLLNQSLPVAFPNEIESWT